MQLVSVAGSSPVLLVQQLIDDNLYLVVVLPQEAGVEFTISKPHCHKPFHWAPRGRESLPLTTHPLGDILAANPLRCVLHGRAGERGRERGREGGSWAVHAPASLVVMSSSCVCCPQVLSTMLNVNQFPFVIDLACWASRREFLKLDKWISDKIKEHQVCVKDVCRWRSAEGLIVIQTSAPLLLSRSHEI